MTRLFAALALVLMLASPPMAEARSHRRSFCVTLHDPGAGPVRICGLPVRRR